MKLTCTQENLNKALNIVGRIINRNTTLPILNNVLLKTDKGRLRLSSTNLELGVSFWIGGKIEEEGEITVPAKLFLNFVSNLPNGNVEIKLRDADVLSVKCNGYKTNIKGLSAKEYPLMPKVDAKPVFKVKSLEFKHALSQVLPAVSTSESRVEITGVFINLEQLSENRLVLATTDSYRLAEKTINLEKENINKEALNLAGNISSVIIPRNAIQELIRDLDDEEEFLEVTISESQILFSFNNASMISRLIEGKYPDYKHIIPAKFEAKSTVSIMELINALKVASLFANASTSSVEVKLLPEAGNMEISAEASEVGSNNTKIPAEISGKELKVMYNYRYLLDGLNSIVGDKAVIDMNDESLPSILTSSSDKSFLYIIMPVRS